MDIVERLRKPVDDIFFGEVVEPIKWEAADEIERLREYERLVNFIANDYHELSYEKAQWQRDDWKKRCKSLQQKENK